MHIQDITIQHYFTMEDSSAYDVFIDVLNPVNRFAGKQCDVKRLTFDQVEVMKSVFINPTVDDIMEIVIMCYGLRGDIKQSSTKQYLLTSIFDLFRAKTFLQNFIIETVNKEKDWLTQEIDEKMIIINSQERLKPFSHLLTKIHLAKLFSTTDSDIGGWRYSKVFTILTATKVRDDLTKEYNEIK